MDLNERAGDDLGGVGDQLSAVLHIVVAGMDFSVGAVVTASAIIAGNLMNMTGTGIPGLIFFSLLSAVLLMENAWFIAWKSSKVYSGLRPLTI